MRLFDSSIWLGVVRGLADSRSSLVAAAVIPGSHHSSGENDLAQRFAVASADAGTPLQRTHCRRASTKVFGTLRYSAEALRAPRIAQREKRVSTQTGPMTSDLTPVSPCRRSITRSREYRRYAERLAATKLGRDVVTGLETAALRAGNRAGSLKRDVERRRSSDYLHLGAVYGLLPTGDLNDDRIAGDADPRSATRISSGLHRDRNGSCGQTSRSRSLAPLAGQAELGGRPSARRAADRRSGSADAHTCGSRAGSIAVTVDPLDFTLRIHEILEDAQRDFMSVARMCRGRGAGVLEATDCRCRGDPRAVVRTVKPIMEGRGSTRTAAPSTGWTRLRHGCSTACATARTAAGPRVCTSSRSRSAASCVDGTLAGTLTALAAGTWRTLETHELHHLPGRSPDASGHEVMTPSEPAAAS